MGLPIDSAQWLRPRSLSKFIRLYTVVGRVADSIRVRIVEEEIESAIEARNEALQTIRELGPPDLVHLIKQSKSGGRQVQIGDRTQG